VDGSDCTPEILANISPDSSVRVDQQAAMAQFDGDFARLGISGEAADVTLDGQAIAIDILGTAVRALELPYGSP
jgi:hypothetical protein